MQFRLKKERNPAISWSEVDHELWMLYMYDLNNPTQSRLRQNPQKCYDYNFKGICARQTCPYWHRCIKCANPHPLMTCRVTSNTMNSRSNASAGRSRSSTATAPSANVDFQSRRQ